jgi:hypothetical protein
MERTATYSGYQLYDQPVKHRHGQRLREMKKPAVNHNGGLWAGRGQPANQGERRSMPKPQVESTALA